MDEEWDGHMGGEEWEGGGGGGALIFFREKGGGKKKDGYVRVQFESPLEKEGVT